jgi:hypothetical protein
VADGAVDRRLVLLVAVDARNHRRGAEWLLEGGCLVHDAVALGAIHGCVFDVAEEDHISDTVHALYWKLSDRVIGMAGFADGRGGESGTIAGLR